MHRKKIHLHLWTLLNVQVSVLSILYMVCINHKQTEGFPIKCTRM